MRASPGAIAAPCLLANVRRGHRSAACVRGRRSRATRRPRATAPAQALYSAGAVACRVPWPSPALMVVMSQWRILAHHHVCWPAAVRHHHNLSPLPCARKSCGHLQEKGKVFTAAGSVTSCRAPGRGRPGARGWGRCRVCGPRHRPHGAGMTGECGSHGQPRLGGTASTCGQAQPSHGVRGWRARAARACRPHVSSGLPAPGGGRGAAPGSSALHVSGDPHVPAPDVSGTRWSRPGGRLRSPDQKARRQRTWRS